MDAKPIAGPDLTPMANRWVAPVSFNNVGIVVFAVDMLLIALVGVACSAAYQEATYGVVADLSRYVGVALVVCTIYGGAAHLRSLYEPLSIIKERRDGAKVAAIWTSVWLFLTVVAFVLKIGDVFSRGAVLSFALAGGASLIIARAVWRRLIRNALASGSFKARRVALISFGAANGRNVLKHMSRHGVHPVQRLALTSGPAGDSWQVALHNFCNDLRGSDAEEIYVACGWAEAAQVVSSLEIFRALPLPVRLVADGDFADFMSRPVRHMDSVVAVEMQRAPLGLIEQGAKRGLDIAVASVAIALLSPIFLLLALAIKVESSGPVLFRQQRQGFNGRTFRILKFRSMRVQEDGATVRQAQKNDRRVTKVGRFIRKTSLDELPQLLNVLLGNMSLVGPRPHAVAHDNYYDGVIADYALRRHVKPGLSGWAQVNGCRGETPTIESMAERVSHDLWYIDNWSLWLDIKILALTLRELKGSKRAY
ncbi:undecaprenyl-phosphate glucose phosphotransferase [Alsobacter metallidurans]|uniref:Undecaprenyl-phosphate glucose phosphotransferase n=2 Tax=Alsobacter metallidurans TaxID=340221 RepID=A0A917I5N2_9HYPH|nr:undecaprenyl-phosphate glucose phosphotransferase [Alsobacter metallidurans]